MGSGICRWLWCGANQPFVFTDANYFLSVIPFLAAVDSGVLGITSDQFTILPPPQDQSKFCYSVSDCKELLGETMDSWNTFFEVLLLSFIPHSSDRQRQCFLWKSFVKDCFYELYTFLNILNIIANRYFTHKWCRNTVHASETQCSHTVSAQNSSILTEYKDIPQMASMQEVLRE